MDPERIAYAIEALIPFWGNRFVADIREGTCRSYCEYRDVSAGTTRRELTTLRAAVNYDYRGGRLTATVPVWLPSRPASKDRWLTRQDAGALLRAAKKRQRGRLHLPLFILIGLYTGARKEAILSLRWPQVDFERGLIDFHPPGRERTGKGRPIIPIPRRLLTFLRLARKRGHELGYVIQFNGRPVGDVKKAFARAVAEAGFVLGYKPAKGSLGRADGPVTWITPIVDVTPHTLRHTAASRMVQKGVSFAKVARYLGHKDSRTTEQTYAHHAPDYLEEAQRAFD